jgi:uncharacterized protein YdaU (DUF1376 family)
VPRKASRASDSPAFQWYPAEYLADEHVTLMTLEEEGAYNRAMNYCWREGSLPSDPVLLSRLLKNASLEVVQTVVQRFRKIETENGTRLVHGRLEKERRKQSEWRRKSSEGGKLSGKLRREKKLQAEANVKGGSFLSEANSTKCFEPNGNSSSLSLSSSLTSVNNTPLPPAATLDHIDISRRVGEECQITSTTALREIQEQAKLDLAAGRIADDIAAELTASIRFYREEKPKLRITWGLEKFIGEGHWRDPRGWPRKESTASKDVYQRFMESDT